MKIIVIGLLLLLSALPAYAETPERVISIGGALTEIIYGLGAQDLLVGSDTTSYYPIEAEKLPKVGYQRVLSAEGILSLGPDIIILTNEAGPPAVIEQIKLAGIPILTLQAGRSVDDVKVNIKAIGEALGKKEQADKLIAEINEESRELAKLMQNKDKPKRVMFILQSGQSGGGAPMVAGTGTAADSIIKMSGAENVVRDYKGYKPLTPEAAVALMPDVILLTSQGVEGDGNKKDILKVPGISLTPAAQEGHVIIMDTLLMLGFGPRTVKAAIQLHKSYQEF